MKDDYPIRLAPGLVDEFQTRGFVVTPDVLSAAEIETYGNAVDAEVARRTAEDGRAVADKSLYEQSFIQCMRLWETCPGAGDLSFHPGLAGIAAQLMQVDEVLLWQDQALYKEAGGRETTPHQDQTFWPLDEAPLVSAWIPFDDVTARNGAMSYVPGSHRAGRLKVVDITHGTEPYDILSDPALEGAAPELVTVSPGSIVWHHGLTVHAASANSSPDTRRVFTVVYLSANARRARAWPAYPLDRAGVGVGEIVRGEGMPRVWPPLEARPAAPATISDPTGPQGFAQP
jgi:ectoine hydroxylase-related dioxygenase (phytanoyl-CoA dioxygenase family)